MIQVEPPPLSGAKCSYNPLVIVSLISGVALVVAFFLAMFFLGILPGAKVQRPAGMDRQLPANVTE